MSPRRAPQQMLSRELLLTRAAAQRTQLALAVHDVRRGATRPTRLMSAAAAWALRRALASKAASMAPLAASGAWWLMRRAVRSRVRWLLVAGVAAGAIWWVVRAPSTDQRSAADRSDRSTDT